MEYKDVVFDARAHPFPPRYRNIFLENLRCAHAEQIGLNIEGLEQSIIKNVQLKNVTIDKTPVPTNLRFVDPLLCDQVRINGKKI